MLLVVFLSLSTASQGYAQGGAVPEFITGFVFDSDGFPLPGATVHWLSGPGTTSDVDGAFQLAAVAGESTIRFSFVGFRSVDVAVATATFPLRMVLEEGNELATVEVTARNKGSFTSILDGRNVESITSKELRKAPCCSLAESFENSPVVDLTYGDPLTGRREIQLLGLRGNYTQFTLEKRPALTGLATPYALDLIPGTWVSGIQIGKGAGSLEAGASGMSGQINTELQKPTTDAPLFVNLFGNSQGRGEANLHLNGELSKTLSMGVYLHNSFTRNKHDRDFDSFKDMPDRNTQSGLVRLLRRNPTDNWEGQWNVLWSKDQRDGGQLTVHDHGQPNQNPYLITQDNQHLEVFGKTGYFGFRKPHQSIGFIYSGTYHQLDNLYGNQRHLGEQQSVYLNTLYHTQLFNSNHKLSVGASAQYDDFVESLGDNKYDRREHSVGGYGEYTYHTERYPGQDTYRAFTAIAGVRADQHSLGGLQVAPRVNLKYNFSAANALRLSAGRGWRSPNVLVENLNRLPSSRQVRFVDQPLARQPGYLGLETAWNFGINYTQNIQVNEREMNLMLDFYRTDFQHQIVVDVEEDLESIYLYQLDGRSFSNSFLASISYEVLPRVDAKLAYKFNDVQTTYRENGLRRAPQIPRHRLLATLDYDGKRFRANVNYQWMGTQRLPDHDQIPATVYVAQPQVAPAFGLLNAQVTYVANSKLEVYAGAENITNKVQRNAIIGAYEPFDGDYFDATQVYQPLNQRVYFVGLRYALPRK